MKKILASILLLTLSSPAFGFWGDDDKSEVCYNWTGGRERCTDRNSLRRETALGGVFQSYYGDRDGSLTGSYGQGLVMTTVRSFSPVRFLFGGQFVYSGANAYINQSPAIATTMMSADLLLGLSIKPYRNTFLQPVIEIDLMGGFKSIQFDSPPTGIDTKNLEPSYGGKLSLGMDLKFWRFHALRPAVEYQYNRLSNIIPGDDLVLDSLGFSLSLVFL